MKSFLWAGLLLVLGCTSVPTTPKEIKAGMREGELSKMGFETQSADTNLIKVYRKQLRKGYVYEARVKNGAVDTFGMVGPNQFNELPRIHAIGSQSFLTFESSTAPGPHREVTIPIEGKNLESAVDNISVKITGTVPLQQGDDSDYTWEMDRKDGASDWILAKLRPSYLAKVKSGDQIDVQVELRRKGDFNKPVCFATRRLTLYDTEYYRQNIQATRIPIHDIQAFPLPEAEARYLFGKVVSENYFVVRLSVRNTQKEDRLVSTGMIVASGRALVIPESQDPNTFTIPVSISPQSTVHMYSILEDRERWQPRSWTFRSLEFIGALATVASTTYGAPAGIIPEEFGTGTSLFTGVFTPELKKFWPDPWPGYKRNMVAYGMPELVKVPKNSVSNQKYLFFSKEKIEAIIADQTLYGNRIWEYLHLVRGKKQPDVRVISLAFDHLDIPFEQVFTPQEVDMKDRVVELQTRVASRIDELSQLRNDVQRGLLFTNVSSAALNQIIGLSKELYMLTTTNSVTNRETQTFLRTCATNLVCVAEAFKNAEFKERLFNDPTPNSSSLRGLEIHRDYLTRLQKRLLHYSDSIVSDAPLNDIEKSIERSRSMTSAYFHAAEVLTDAKLIPALQALLSIDELNKMESEPRTTVLQLMLQLREESTGLNVWKHPAEPTPKSGTEAPPNQNPNGAQDADSPRKAP